MLGCRLYGQSAGDYATNGLTEIVNKDLEAANSNFVAALALEPTNEIANVMLAATRLLLVPQTPAGSNFLNGLNFPKGGRDVFNWTSEPPRDAFGGPKFPANYNSTNIVFFFRTNTFPLIAASLTNLANVTNTDFSFTLIVPEDDKLVTNTVDYGDVQLFRSGLYAAYFLAYTLDANNAGFILPQIVSSADTNGLTIQRVLATYPSLLTPYNTNDLISSENALSNAATLYLTASDFIRNDRSLLDNNDLITIANDEANREADFRMELSNVLSSLTVPTQFNPNEPDSIVYLGPYLSGKYSVRKEVPLFFNNTYVDNAIPDYTFGGVLPDVPAYKTENAFRNLFPTFAGVYTGNSADKTNGVSDFDHQNNVSYTNGAFAVYISTNGQSTLFGYDGGDGLNDQTAFSFLVNFTVNAQGKWQTSNSVFDAFGSVDTSNNFNGQINYLTHGTNYYSVYLRANGQSALGPFQNFAGFYTGSYSTTNGGGGTLDGILAADGEMFFIPVLNGQPVIGGNGKFTTATTVTLHDINGITGQGTLNPFLFMISGIFYNGGGVTVATFTMSRAAKVNFDMPPVITANLPASVNIPLGNTLKLTLGVSGSPPLNYQWYLNGYAVPGAISSTLIVSNNLWQTTGTNYISASVNNVAGETNSRVTTVSVGPETNAPTLTITSPKPGQLWSNATFNVTGTTSDKLGITSVYFYTNSGFFTLAATSNNWTSWNATATLSPGTNTITVFAFNEGGIAATNSVKLVYVQTAFLTVITNGPGTITPAYTNALRIGTFYSMTAAGKVGYKVMSWTGGTNQPFSFYTNGATVQFAMSNNLTMQANFMDTNQPLVKITNVPAGPGLVLSSNAYTVMGTATDVEAMQSVQYSLNGSAFTPATTSDGWAHWSDAPLSLEGGTNLFSAYATGTNGVNSATNTVRIFVISSNVLQLSVSGKGTISPNYSNAVLRVGVNYTMTATAKPGWVFTNWTGAISNSPMIPVTQKPTLTFLMQSNLDLQANFVDTNKPIVKVTNAISGLVLSSNTFTFMGTVTDDVAIASVNCSLNGNPVPGVSTNAMTNGVSWSSGSLSLAGGTNIFSVYAVATNGNISAANNLRIIFVSTNQLTLQTSGNGTISPNYSNAWLRVGQNYTMTATALHGWVFSSWSSGTDEQDDLVVLTNKPTVLFMMFSNLIMQANFVDTNKPFVKITNAPAGAVVTNEFILMGTATDDVEIASVSYSLDGSPFTPIGVTSPITNGVSWSADLMVQPGTNKFAAYAVATNGSISATNNIIIVRQPALALFPIDTNDDLKHPQASMAFDGANYFVVYSVPSNSGGAEGQFVSPTGLLGSLLNLNPGTSDDPPYVAFDVTNYITAWADTYAPDQGIFVDGRTVTTNQTLLFGYGFSHSTNVNSFSTIVYGGGYNLLMWDDGSTSPDSIVGAMISPGGGRSSDFLISPNGQEDEAGGPQAAFDGSNFLAAWASKTGNFMVSGQLIDPLGNLVGNPIVIYSNSTPAAIALPSVTFDGTKYLVLFNTGLNNTANPGSFHIQGRFVTTEGNVLTNQVNLTADAGPQIIASAAFDGANYLITWNQGFNPFVMTASATINGRFFDINGNATSAEFPIFKTKGSLVPLWDSMLYDDVNANFVLAAGLGKMTSTANSNSGLKFTNGVIYGAFVSP
jgi:hypothetical protein